MKQIGPRGPSLLLAAALALAAGCREKPKAGIDELFTLRSQGLVFLQQGQLPEAEQQFRQLVELAPDEPLGHANLGLTYLREGRTDEAEKELERARKLDPNSADIGLMLARLYAESDRPDEARSLLEALEKSSPQDAHVRFALAELDSRPSDAAGLAPGSARGRRPPRTSRSGSTSWTR